MRRHGRLTASAQALRALEGARSVVFLIGGYDGTGNFGDLLQYEAAAELVSSLGPAVVPIGVLEDVYADGHATGFSDDRWVTFRFRAAGDERADRPDHVPAALPSRVRSAATYLYGGGYLNGDWGPGRLDLLAAAEDVIQAHGLGIAPPITSGLQVEPGFIDGLGPEGRQALHRVDWLGVRDEASAAATGSLPARQTGDDAVGLLGKLDLNGSRPRDADGRAARRVNVQFAAWPWVTDDEERATAYVGALLSELDGGAGVGAQPVVAYDDRTRTELPMVARLEAAAATATFAAPLVPRPATLAGDLATLAVADLTITCSYHVALASLLLGVPAALLADTEYYRQKSAGLRADFGLSPAWTLDSRTDAARAAAALVAELQPAREALARARAPMLLRRARAERDLVAALGQRLLSTVAADPAAEGYALARLRMEHQSLVSVAREQRARLDQLTDEVGQLRSAAAAERDARADAEARATQAAGDAAAATARLTQVEEAHQRTLSALSTAIEQAAEIAQLIGRLRGSRAAVAVRRLQNGARGRRPPP